MITRAEILRRSVELWPKLSITYSQSVLRSNTEGVKYRTDCSGYLSLCWGIAPNGPGCWGGGSTVTLVTHGYMYEIPWSDLLPGDAIGECGPNTGGAGGHIMLWLSGGKAPGARALVRDFGSTPGWKERTVTIPGVYKAYRFVGVEDARATRSGGAQIMYCKHGDKGDAVKGLQAILHNMGLLPVAGVDGDYGNATAGALKVALADPNEDGRTYGHWQYAALFREMAKRYAGKDGAPGAPGKPGEQGPPGPGLKPGDSFTVTVAG